MVVLSAVIAIPLVILAYYHFLYKSARVDGGIVFFYKMYSLHDMDVFAVRFTPDGKSMVTAAADGKVKVTNLATGGLDLRLVHPIGCTYLDISPDGRSVATSSYDGIIRIWDLRSGHLRGEFAGHTGTVWHVAFDSSGKSLVSGGEDATVKIWDVESGQLRQTMSGHKRTVWSVKFNRHGNQVASGSYDNTIKIWDVATGKLVGHINAHKQAVVDVAFSHNGNMLASAADDNTVKIWEVGTWRLIHVLKVPEHAQALAFSPDDKRLITGGRDKPTIGELLQNFFGDSEYNKGMSARIWNVENGKLLQTCVGHTNDVNDVTYSPDGNWFATGSSDKSIVIWKVVR